MIASVDHYRQVLEKSRLIEPDELERQWSAFHARHAGRATLGDPTAFALALVTAGLLTTWQQEKLAQGHTKGFFLGQYKLLGLLGVGGMGAVYLAEHVRMRRRVAIKVLPARLVKDASYLARFHKEAQSIASLDHSNIIQAYSVDNEGDLHYLVMQYVEGRDLEQVVREQGPLAPDRAARLIRQAADGLSHAHQRGLVHRDIKPSNLLVDQADNVRILDLGLACDAGQGEASGSDPQENVVGTTDYLAPEQALGGPLDSRVDLYSLGCTVSYATSNQDSLWLTLPTR